MGTLSRKATVVAVAVLAALAVNGVGAPLFGDPKPTDSPVICGIMRQAFGGGYMNRNKGIFPELLEGRGGDKEKESLLKLFTDLSQAKPPKGELEDWKKRTAILIKDAKEILAGGDGEKEALARLKKDADCKSCHKTFTKTQ